MIAQTDAFWNWFGKSRVVDSTGDPLVVYHGTQTGPFKVFERSSYDLIFFTDNEDVAVGYSESRIDPLVGWTRRGIYRVYLRIENPMYVDAEFQEWDSIKFNGNIRSVAHLATIAQKGGYDGLIVYNVDDPGEYGFFGIYSTVYVVFDPKQIKSATSNNGDYDPDDEDITKNPDWEDEDGRREAMIYIWAAKGDVRESRTIIAHAVKDALCIKNLADPPYRASYLSVRQLQADTGDKHMTEPRFLLTVNDTEMIRIWEKLQTYFKDAGWDKPPIEIYHD